MKRLCSCGYFTESVLWTQNICPLCVERHSRSAAVEAREQASRTAEYGRFQDGHACGRDRLTCEHDTENMCDTCRRERSKKQRLKYVATRKAKRDAHGPLTPEERKRKSAIEMKSRAKKKLLTPPKSHTE